MTKIDVLIYNYKAGWINQATFEQKVKELLQPIIDHNFRELSKVDYDQGAAKNLFTISHEGTAVFDFCHDETLIDTVEPMLYYGLEPLEKVIAAFENWKK